MDSMIFQADVLHLPLADQSVDLVLGSPPYCDARTYNDGTLPEGHVVSRDAAAWVDWMLAATRECLRVSRGAVVWVAAGVTRDRTYWPACEGLMWEWFKGGGSMYRPAYWHRVGIPGGGGDQWLRPDVEYCMCFKRDGSLPWTDNTAMGHPPKWAPGGEMRYRLGDGTRTNQWGKPGAKTGTTVNGNKEKATTGKPRPSHVVSTKGKMRRMAADSSEPKVVAALADMPVGAKFHTKETANGERVQVYLPPVKANPGNFQQWADDPAWDIVEVEVGGGHMGDKACHENEAPYPEKLAEFFIRSLCPPDGIVCDPFSGSGTTAKVAVATGRKYVASDIRGSQVALTRKRLAKGVQRTLV